MKAAQIAPKISSYCQIPFHLTLEQVSFGLEVKGKCPLNQVMLHFIFKTLKSTNCQRLEINYKSFATCRASQILELVTSDLDDKLQERKKVFSPLPLHSHLSREHMHGFIKMSISGGLTLYPLTQRNVSPHFCCQIIH